MSELWLSAIFSPKMIANLAPWILIVIGAVVEKNFVGRVITFSNSMALNIHAATIGITSSLLSWYANIGLIVGIVAIGSYAIDESLPDWFYVLNILYCSVIAGVLLLIF